MQNSHHTHRSPIKVITFDLDDTLWDVTPVIINAEQAVFEWLEQHAPKLTDRFNPDSFRKLKWEIYLQNKHLANQISELRTVAVEQALLQVNYSPEIAADYAKKAFKVFIDARHEVILFDTVRPMLEQLQGRYSLGVLTNGNADIGRTEISTFFDFSFSAEQLNASKPAPDHFIAAQNASGAAAKEIVHIGDNLEHDVVAAQNAGCHAIWYNPDKKDCPPETQCQNEVHCLSAIPEAIKAIEERLKNI